MRTPQNPPNWRRFFDSVEKELRKVFETISRPEIEQLVREVNEKYLHWDKLRFRDLPPGIDPKVIWFAVKMSRRSQRTILPLSFTGGQKLSYILPAQHLEWIHSIDKQAGGAIGLGTDHGLPDDDDRYLFNSLMEEAIASSQLEGASTTRKVAKEMLRRKRKPRNKAEQMIVNNYKAILEVRDLKKEKLTPRLLCHLQQVLTDQTLEKAEAAGRFRLASEAVEVTDARTDEVLHIPPPADEVERRTQEICDFANAVSDPFVHPVIKAAVLHFALGYVHPFVDGNGRTARAIFYWYMLKQDYWLFEYLPISRVLVRSPAKYAKAYLYTETDEGDVTYFIRYHLAAIQAAMTNFQEYVLQEQGNLSKAAKLLESFPGLNSRQRSVIQDALKHPNMRLTIRSHQGKYHIAYPTARADLLGLGAKGLLTEVTEGRAKVFRPHPELKNRLHLPSS
jgi:Fic family protein